MGERVDLTDLTEVDADQVALFVALPSQVDAPRFVLICNHAEREIDFDVPNGIEQIIYDLDKTRN